MKDEKQVVFILEEYLFEDSLNNFLKIVKLKGHNASVIQGNRLGKTIFPDICLNQL